MPLVFDSFQTAPSSPTATYYVHALTAIPTGSESTVAGLARANPPGYAPLDLTVITSLDGAITNWDFADGLWSALSWNVSLVGTAVILQVGTTKNPAVDRPFLFYEFENGLRAPIVLTPGYFSLRFSTGVNYALSVQAANKYDTGAFVGFPFYKDLLTLLASNNGTRYTPVSALTNSQFSSGTWNQNYNPNFSAYWIGDRAAARELQGRHDLAYNNVTFPTLGSPVLGFNAAATFNGIDSFVTLGNTTPNGADFNLYTGPDGQQMCLLYFQPTLANTPEILLDTTTSSSSGGYIVRKTADNKVEFGFITAGTPHTIVSLVSTNTLNIGAWNLVMFGSYVDNRKLCVNNVVSSVFVGGFNSPVLTNGIRLGSRRGLSSTFTGANFTGKILYFANAFTFVPDGSASMPAIANRDTQAPYNQSYDRGWSITGANTNAEMTAPNSFPAHKSTFLRSIGNLDTYVGAQNLVATGDIVPRMRIDSAECFYVNFGQNKVRPGTIALIFPTDNNLNAIKLDTNASSAVFSVWGANTLPNNAPTNANLTNPLLWDKYEFTINGINNSGTISNISGLTLISSGGYRFLMLDTSITKHYKYLKLGWKNAVAGGAGGSVGFAHYLLYNSSVLSPSLDAVPPATGYGS